MVLCRMHDCHVSMPPCCAQYIRRGEPNKSRAVTALAISPAESGGGSGNQTAVLAVARTGGSIDLLSATDGMTITTLPAAAPSPHGALTDGASTVRSMFFLRPIQASFSGPRDALSKG